MTAEAATSDGMVEVSRDFEGVGETSKDRFPWDWAWASIPGQGRYKSVTKGTMAHGPHKKFDHGHRSPLGHRKGFVLC